MRRLVVDRLATIAVLVLVVTTCTVAAVDAVREGALADTVAVERILVDAWIVDHRGVPIEDLAPHELAAWIDDQPATVEALEWVPAGPPAAGAPVPKPTAAAIAPASVPSPPGRVMLLFVQTDRHPSRVLGTMRTVHQASHLLDRLLPTDRVAVVHHDGARVRLLQDLTADAGALRHALEATIGGRRGKESDRASSESAPLSLARYWDEEAARQAWRVEDGLAVAASTLEPIPGAKSIVYLGWSLGADPAPRAMAALERAVDALGRARAALFVLDVADADFHSLEIPLRLLSRGLGGGYQKTVHFAAAALERVERWTRGRFVVVLATAHPLEPGRHSLELELDGRRGQVFARSFFDTGPTASSSEDAQATSGSSIDHKND